MWTEVPNTFACGWRHDNGCLSRTGFDPRRSHWGQYTNSRGNCTNYVAYRLRRNGAPPLRGTGSAWSWKDRVRSQYGRRAVDHTPAIGAVAWWGSGRGHVAYVEYVSARGAVYLSESAWNLGSRRRVLRRGQRGYPDAFLHLKDGPTRAPAGRLGRVFSPGAREVRVEGWVVDPDAPQTAVRLRARIGGQERALGRADQRGRGRNHGFGITFSTPVAGRHRICVVAENIGLGTDRRLGCRAVSIPAAPTPTPTPSPTPAPSPN